MSASTFTPRPLFGAGILTITALIWSTYGVLVRLLGYNIPFFYGVWIRNIVAGILLLLPLLWLKQFKPMSKHDFGWALARSCVGLLGMTGSFAGYFYLPIGTAYFINFGGMTIGSFVLGKMLFNEKATPIKLLSLFLALVGMSLVYQVSIDPSLSKYLWIVFFAGWAGAFWSVAAKKLASTYTALQLNVLDFWIFGVVGMAISLFRHEVWSWPTLTLPWITNLIFLLMFMVTGQLVIVGFKHLDAQRGSLVLLLEIVLGSVLGALVFHEKIGWLAGVGGFLILAAAALPELQELMHQHQVKTQVIKP